jgi:threonine synthase
LYLKLETANPSGSYKDRFAAFAIADLLRKKSKRCLATSSGNTGAALAAYAAAAGLPCYIVLVEGAPEGKLAQMQAHGAHLVTVKGFGINKEISESIFAKLALLASHYQTQIQVSAFRYSPVGMQGVQTIGFELAEDLPEADHVFVPAGGGGLALAICRGYQLWKHRQPEFKLPKIHCVQPEGNNTIAGNLRAGLEHAQAVENAFTRVSGLQVANVIDGDKTLQACRLSGGNGYLVSDEEVFDAQQILAKREGVFAEPAGAVAVAGWKKSVEFGEVSPDEKAVCIVTGNGFKDPPSIAGMIAKNPLHFLEDVGELEIYFNSNEPNQ